MWVWSIEMLKERRQKLMGSDEMAGWNNEQWAISDYLIR